MGNNIQCFQGGELINTGSQNTSNPADSQNTSEPVDDSDAASTSPNLLHTIINNQEMIAKRLIKLEKGMQEIFSQLQNVAGMVSSFSSSGSSTSETCTEKEAIVFQKIDDEDGIIEFEKTIEDRNNRKKMIDYFVSVIGKCNNVPTRSIALQLEQKMFTESFWTKTAWTGGRKLDGPKKFPFSAHMVCIAFMNDVIGGVCGTQMTDGTFSEFIKSRTRNSGYIRTTNRQASARAPRKRKHSMNVGDENAQDAANQQNQQTSNIPIPKPLSTAGENGETGVQNEQK